MLPFICYLYVTSGGPCPRGGSFTLFYFLLQSSFPSVHVLTLLSSLSFTYIETYGNHYLLLFLVVVLSLSLFSRLAANLLSRCSGSDDTSPSSSLLPLSHSECILLPPRGATSSVSPLSISFGDVDVDGLLSRVILLLANTFSVSSLSTGGCYSSPLPLKFVRFRDCRHHPVAADDVRKILLLV
jgi:hypothetical protein